MRVLFVTTEMDDFVRVGGLAAVSAALPRALRLWSDVRIILPGYRDVVEHTFVPRDLRQRHHANEEEVDVRSATDGAGRIVML